MLVENNEFRPRPRAVTKSEEPWRRELRLIERARDRGEAKALSTEQRRAEMLSRWTPLIAAAAADMEMVRELGRKTPGVSAAWSRDLGARLQSRIAQIVRMIDEDQDGILQVEGMTVPVRAAVERVLTQRARAAQEFQN